MGTPTRILKDAGLTTYAVASPTMVAAFRERLPRTPIEQATVEASESFNRTFSGVLAWGLMFLLDSAAQALVIENVARSLDSFFDRSSCQVFPFGPIITQSLANRCEMRALPRRAMRLRR